MNQNKYILIVYRPDGTDTCRGCVMSTTSSDFDIFAFETLDEVKQEISNKCFNNYKLQETDNAYCNYVFTVSHGSKFYSTYDSYIGDIQSDEILESAVDDAIANGHHLWRDYKEEREATRLLNQKKTMEEKKKNNIQAAKKLLEKNGYSIG